MDTKRIVRHLSHTFVGDVLATVLALYMHDKQQPLPSHEEVLICTPETTTEEVSGSPSSSNALYWRFIFSLLRLPALTLFFILTRSRVIFQKLSLEGISVENNWN